MKSGSRCFISLEDIPSSIRRIEMSIPSGKRNEFVQVVPRGVRSGICAEPGPVTAVHVADPEQLDSGISVDLRDRLDREHVDAMEDSQSTTLAGEDGRADFVHCEETLLYPEEEQERIDSGFQSGQGLSAFVLPKEIQAFLPNSEGDQ